MPAWNESFLTEVLAGLGLLILCILGYKTIAWFRQDVRGSARRDEDALLPFREAMEAGEISREEFDRVSASMMRHRSPESTGRPVPPLYGREEGPGTPETPSTDSS